MIMKKQNFVKRLLIIVVAIAISFQAYAQEEKPDLNSSPYFVVLQDNDEVAQLPLKSTDVTVNVSGVVANVNVKQVYTNTGNSTIEAIYVFPASTRAAVYDVVMKINDRVIKAEIKEKGKARQLYNQARKNGNTASLLEEDKPNIFKMNVANIIPGATVEVLMSYVESLVSTDKTYEFMYPTVVGPQYVNKNGNKQEKANAVQNPYLHSGIKPVSKLNIKVKLSSGMPIQQISCATHKNEIIFQNKNNAVLILNDEYGGNRDFICRYKLAGNKIESGVLTYEDRQGEKYFLAMMEPPLRELSNEIPNREYVFIVDVSGSMHGFPLDISKRIMKEVLEKLDENDLFNIVFFAGGSNVYSPQSIPATKENIIQAINYMDSLTGGGDTELLEALKSAMNLNSNKDFSRSFVILTDGYVTVEKETFDYIRTNLGEANFFSFGIGTSVNRYIIEGMARVGCGESFVAENKDRADVLADKFINYISHPVLTNIKYHFKGIEVYDVLPQQVPDLFADRPIVISGKYKGEGNGELIIEGENGVEHITKQLKINSAFSKEDKGLKYLWAREKLSLLSDYNSLGYSEATKSEIIALGLKYNLLTQYTSFIAIDSVVSNLNGKQETIFQPNPMPQGVSDYAIGELNIVDDDAEICEDTEIEFVCYEEEETDEEPVFFIVEEQPQYPGGEEALKKFIIDNIQYPVTAAENGIQGRVYVSFTIDIDGSITDVKVVRSISPELDAEAIRIVKALPKWKPAKQRGKTVKITYTIPITFSLS